MKTCKLTELELSDLCRELSYLLQAGGNSADTLSLLAEGEPRAALRAVLQEMSRQLDAGASLDQAFRDAGCFPDYLCAMLTVGVRTGRTEDTLRALADYYENRAALERQVRSSLLYPAILLVIMLAVVVILLVKVLPIFDAVYAELGGSLSGVAGGLLSLGRWLDQAMPVLCALLALVVLALVLFAAVPQVRDKVLHWWRGHFGNRGVARKLNTARLAQALSMCLSSGVPMDEALQLSAGLLRDVPEAEANCRDCAQKLADGVAMADALFTSGLFPGAQCRLLELGVKSGSDDVVMRQIADRLGQEAEEALEEKLGRVEPTLVLVTSLLLGLILLSVMLPLMHIMSAIG